MSEHAWTLENLAALVAGGLTADERERLERHAADCADCGRAVADARRADRQLMTLFADDRPGPALEDRLIRSLREPRRAPRRRVSAIWIKAPLAIAAVALVAVIGAGVTALIDNDWQLGFMAPEMAKAAASIQMHGPMLHGMNVGGKEKESDLSRVASTDYHSYGKAGKLLESEHWQESREGPKQSPEEIAGEILKRTPFQARVTKSDVTALDNSNSMNLLPDVSVPGPVDPKVRVGLMPSGTLTPEQVPASPGAGGGMMGMGGGMGGIAGFNGGAGAPQLPPPPEQGGPVQMDALPSPRPIAPESRTKESQMQPPVTEQYFQPPFRQFGTRIGRLLGQNGQEITPAQQDLAVTEKPATQLPDPSTVPPAKTEPGGDKKPPQPEQPRSAPRYIIRTGEMEFEVDSFDAAAAVVRKLAAAAKGFVTNEKSGRLANGKISGYMTVRMPPDQLDKFVLDLRQQLGKTAELKGQKIGSEDVSKVYVDLESGLKSARTMQERFLKMIKEGKGQIKDLIAAEQALGTWNTKVEEYEGQLRYYRDLISLSTVTITMHEKDIRVAAAVRERERVDAGVEVEDVEKAMREVLKAVDDAKGRVTRQELQQHDVGGQFSAILEFDVPPATAGPVRDRLNQLGTVTRLKIDRVQTPEGGEKLPTDGKLQRGNTQFILSLYNLANITPQETTMLSLATADVAAAYRTVRAAIEKAKGRIMGVALEQKSPQQIGASMTFAVPRQAEPAIRAALGEAGEVLTRSVTRVAQPAGATEKDQAQLVTDKKVAYTLRLISAAEIQPRETVDQVIEVRDVEEALDVLTAKVKELKGRIIEGPKSAHELNGRVSALVAYEVPLAAAPALAEKLRNSGQLREKVVMPNQQAPEGKLAVARFVVRLTSAQVLVPRDEGITAEVRSGLSYSLRGLSVSVRVLIVGLLFVLPWVLLIAAAWWLVRRIWRRPAVVTVVTPTPPTAPPAASA